MADMSTQCRQCVHMKMNQREAIAYHRAVRAASYPSLIPMGEA